MNDALTIIGPVFGLIGLGVLAARLGLIGSNAAAGISEFVFVLAIPALLFRTLATAPLPPIDPLAFWASYFVPLALVWSATSLAARRFFGSGPTEAILAGFAAAQANTVLIGIPLVLRALGEAAMPAVLLIVGIHLPITIAAASIAIESVNGRRPSLLALATRVLGHPIILAILAGGLWRLAGPPLPDALLGMLKLLGEAAAPGALVATGLSLAAQGFSGFQPLTGLAGLMKLIVQPLLVYAAAVLLFDLPAVFATVAVLFAACPTGVNAYLLAQRHGEGVSFTSGLIALTTAGAVLTVSLLLTLLLP